ncbi:MAG: RtcB family protein [Deltaproteobacteria bacterium]|nr:RtcB family protein [Deltaproteobacteria bacterium]MBW1951783.1 RtcB family protein [Deltaproteobacteria bacterium]MBW1985650.1 RtcB family protein [Deltaproteobacteria bacterium]MBW2134410.1 RtcB family protein [Deltaproteobacteria bacterium]
MKLRQIDQYRWEIPPIGKMRTRGLIFASQAMLPDLRSDQSIQQVANVATLPGIEGASMAMPDIHWGYGFPIGGVAAFNMTEGIISPGGVGYDINCGVRLLRTNLQHQEVEPILEDLVNALFRNIPSGLGSRRKDLKLTLPTLRQVLRAGAAWAVKNGFGTADDLLHIEAGGQIPGADADLVSDKALERGRDQLGTLGSGNHFVEVGYVGEIFDDSIARAFGLFPQQITVIIHTGSRGLGHQVCDDYIKIMMRAAAKYGIELPDRQLCCAPLTSPEGEQYLAAMAAAANFAFANRQLITHWVRESFEQVWQAGPRVLGLELVYDVAHNIAKIETHTINQITKKVCVHRKGATRAFAPHHPEVPEAYREVGQPVLIPGDMGRYSYVLVGTPQAMMETFGSTCHGAGRLLSRHQALKAAKGRSILQELAAKGIVVRGASRGTIAEEIPEAYKDVDNVVEVVHGAGISRKVAKLHPLGVIKG